MKAPYSNSLVCWTYSDKLSSTGKRRSACVIITPDGMCYKFHGEPILGVVTIEESIPSTEPSQEFTTYKLQAPEGSAYRIWFETRNREFWPQPSWDEVLKTFQEDCPSASINLDSLRYLIDTEWEKEAEKFQ